MSISFFNTLCLIFLEYYGLYQSEASPSQKMMKIILLTVCQIPKPNRGQTKNETRFNITIYTRVKGV